jgi:histidinol dehydrogenase
MLAQDAFANAQSELSPELVRAIDVAYENIYAFHKAQQTDVVRLDTQEGVSLLASQKADR